MSCLVVVEAGMLGHSGETTECWMGCVASVRKDGVLAVPVKSWGVALAADAGTNAEAIRCNHGVE